jgi:HK97 family phage prohead protease
MNKQYLFFSKKSLEDLGERTILAIGSTEDIDRAGDIMKLDNFLKNPIILLNHDYKSLPIGKALEVNKTNEGLVFKIQFADTILGREVYDLYKNGMMNSFSVGFRGKKPKQTKDGIKIFDDVELLELSCVTVPCNPNAVALTKSFMEEVQEKMDLPEIHDILKKYLEQINEETNNTEEQKSMPVKTTVGNISLISIYRKVSNTVNKFEHKEDQYVERYLEDIFPTEYPIGACVACEKTYNKDYSFASERNIEYMYSFNENNDVILESEKEVEPAYVAKMVMGKNIENSLNTIVIKENKNQEVLEKLEQLTNDLKKIANITILNNEAIKLLADNEKEVPEVKAEIKEEEVKEEKEIDIQEILKNLKEELDKELSFDIKSVISEELKKQLGKI